MYKTLDGHGVGALLGFKMYEIGHDRIQCEFSPSFGLKVSLDNLPVGIKFPVDTFPSWQAQEPWHGCPPGSIELSGAHCLMYGICKVPHVHTEISHLHPLLTSQWRWHYRHKSQSPEMFSNQHSHLLRYCWSTQLPPKMFSGQHSDLPRYYCSTAPFWGIVGQHSHLSRCFPINTVTSQDFIA